MTNTTDKAMRKAFEAWLHSPECPIPAGTLMTSVLVNHAWAAWQAALASSAAVPEQEDEATAAPAAEVDSLAFRYLRDEVARQMGPVYRAFGSPIPSAPLSEPTPEGVARPECMSTIAGALNPRNRFKPTPGEWVADAHGGWAYPITEVRTPETRENGGHSIARVHANFHGTVGKSEYEWANAAFVAACSPQNMREVLAYIDRLEALAALSSPASSAGMDAQRLDAERYRWLRREVHGPRLPLAQVVWKQDGIRASSQWTNLCDGSSLDEHIDAAIASKEQP